MALDDEVGQTQMNLAAAVQVLSAVTVNIACMIGYDKAKEALLAVLEFEGDHREMVKAIRVMDSRDSKCYPEIRG